MCADRESYLDALVVNAWPAERLSVAPFWVAAQYALFAAVRQLALGAGRPEPSLAGVLRVASDEAFVEALACAGCHGLRARGVAPLPLLAERALQHGGEEGAEELVRDGPQLLFALLRFLCRPGRWSTRLKLQRPPEGSAQVDGNVAKIDLAARGVDGALVHFNAPSWAVRAVMSSTTLPVCPKTGSTSPSLTVHLCLHTAPGNRECAPRDGGPRLAGTPSTSRRAAVANGVVGASMRPHSSETPLGRLRVAE